MRDLHLTSPNMRGVDIQHLQVALNARLGLVGFGTAGGGAAPLDSPLNLPADLPPIPDGFDPAPTTPLPVAPTSAPTTVVGQA